MIINSNNKDIFFKGKMKRGFNQTPEELKEKIYNDINNIKRNNEKETKQIISNDERPEALKINEALKNLKKLK